jgi:hypothetical protein
MHNLVTDPIRASRHLAIWLVWQCTGVNLLASPRRNGVSHVEQGHEAARRRLRQAG